MVAMSGSQPSRHYQGIYLIDEGVKLIPCRDKIAPVYLLDGGAELRVQSIALAGIEFPAGDQLLYIADDPPD